MEKTNSLLKSLFICCLVCASIFVTSGFILLGLKISDNKSHMLKQITFTSYNETQQVSVFSDIIFPSESASYRVEVKSNLIENCKYSINFKNHTVIDEDKLFYVSIYTESNPYLMNNTLSQIFTEGLSISDQVLPSYSKEDIYFVFSIDKELSRSVDFDFDIVFTAEGKLPY